ncbi:MAG TPA: hypothetical protein VFQ20_06635 [Burkholderiaceae bacterium]|nr:hypothetical protein [Burkholderiaceae bacterium]
MSTTERPLTALHRRRLRDLWRSAGWPCQDMVEVELLAAGLVERLRDADGRETLRVTDAGIAVLAATLQRNRAVRDAHEALVARVVLELQRGGRFAWRGLALRARIVDAEHPKGERWANAMPDVFSVRHTSVAGYLRPEVHEIKVRRADLLSDLRRPHKRAAYLAMAGACWYVLAEGVGDADDVPGDCGVLVARGEGFATLELQRAAPARAMPFEAGLPFAVWMALARADVERSPDADDAQARLGPAPA